MRKGILLINLGSPDSTSPKDVRRYLNQFLMDPYVIDIPTWLRHILVKAIITPRRSYKSAAAYEVIWTEEGSPLVTHTRNFARKFKELVQTEADVRWAMRYGKPSVEDVVKDWDVDQVLVVPMYPQYAESSTRTAIDEAKKFIKPPMMVHQDFFAHPAYIEAQARQIQKHLSDFKPDHLLLSYHGLPEHHLSKLHPEHCFQSKSCCDQVTEANRNCYRAQCFATSRGLMANLNFPREKISVSFQSRLGRKPWIKPYTDLVVPELVQRGVRRLSVACPSFVSDCLETLEEIQVRLKEQFIECGGEDLKLIPALNDSDDWVRAFREVIK